MADEQELRAYPTYAQPQQSEQNGTDAGRGIVGLSEVWHWDLKSGN